jgi:hypothetical protein
VGRHQRTAVLARWIDRRCAAGLRRWWDTPRSGWSDALYVNAVVLFLLRIGNVVVRPYWRRLMGITCTIVLIEMTWNMVDAITFDAPATPRGQLATVLNTVGRRYVVVASHAAFVGCLALFVNVVLIAGRRRR